MNPTFKKATEHYYMAGPLNIKFEDLEEARLYARESSARRGRPVWIRSHDGTHRELIGHYKKPENILPSG